MPRDVSHALTGLPFTVKAASELVFVGVAHRPVRGGALQSDCAPFCKGKICTVWRDDLPEVLGPRPSSDNLRQSMCQHHGECEISARE